MHFAGFRRIARGAIANPNDGSQTLGDRKWSQQVYA